MHGVKLANWGVWGGGEQGMKNDRGGSCGGTGDENDTYIEKLGSVWDSVL